MCSFLYIYIIIHIIHVIHLKLFSFFQKYLKEKKIDTLLEDHLKNTSLSKDKIGDKDKKIN